MGDVNETPAETDAPSPSGTPPPESDPLAQTVARLAADLEHRDRQLEAIRRTSDALFSHPSIDTMIEATLDVALEVLRADAGTVFLYDSPTDTLVFRYVVGEAKEKLQGTAIPASKGVAGTVFRSGQPVLVGDVRRHGDFNADVDRKTGFQTHSMMTVPVRRVGAEPIGVMQVLNARVPFTAQDMEVLEVLCAQAATGLEHAQLLEAQRNAEIGNRVGEIAHDIKNMMTPIETGVMTLQPEVDHHCADLEQLAAQCPETEPWGATLRGASESLQGLTSWLLEDLLTSAQRVRRRTEYIAGMVKGNLPPPVFETGDINTVAGDVLKTLKRTARDRGLELVSAFDPNLKPMAFDYDRIYDCLYNLVNNALPETPPGGTVTLRTLADDDAVVLQVQDTGRGIPEAVRSRLFTREAISTKKGGTGLGTSVAARVVQEHGGTIAVDSEVGQGTTFTIRLPRERPPAP